MNKVIKSAAVGSQHSSAYSELVKTPAACTTLIIRYMMRPFQDFFAFVLTMQKQAKRIPEKRRKDLKKSMQF